MSLWKETNCEPGMVLASPLVVALSAALGAKLRAIRCGLVWTAVDAGGIESLSFRAVWTAVDARGHGLEIYGSGGGLASHADDSTPLIRLGRSFNGRRIAL